MNTESDARAGPVQHIHGISSIIDRYDGCLLDLWGVIHNGVAVFDHARDCLVQLRQRNIKILFLSNAPRRARIIIQQLADFGIDPSLYDGVLSSGEDAWCHLRNRNDGVYATLGQRCFPIGPERDVSMLEGLNLDVVLSPEKADFILNTGPSSDGDSVERYEDILRRGVQSSIPMICLNPDLEVIRGSQRIICAGALALRYEALGGHVHYHGKPHQGMYDRALQTIGITDKRKILAVGDSLRTDIQGACHYAIPSLLVLDGLHQRDVVDNGVMDKDRCQALWRQSGLRPDRTIRRFSW